MFNSKRMTDCVDMQPFLLPCREFRLARVELRAFQADGHAENTNSNQCPECDLTNPAHLSPQAANKLYDRK
jgi:hypothetical protein